MLAMPSGTPACPETGLQHRLAAQLADMIPSAAIIRVSFTDPTQTWPHLHAVVKDETGKTMEVSCTTARVAGRWILRVWPEVDWTRPHTLHLADATLTHSEPIAAGRGR
ncbi:transcriptional regulator [Streptomyces sp. WAC08241]|uniref:transcriptional regulator n=1 Tax=Streptomyces sp. WAC08241 TaxID=2487421 RepID=UPI000F78FD84|nr:transcriptional regulator [Streptomyces sp. WAC08241]RSS46231.1 transcriptional regulator [Streptomyces sp. WAC08241]